MNDVSVSVGFSYAGAVTIECFGAVWGHE